MQIRRSTLAALVFGALTIGWLFPMPASTAQIPPDFTFASGDSVDRLTVLVEALVMSLEPAQFARFRQALSTIAGSPQMSADLRRHAQALLDRLESQGR